MVEERIVKIEVDPLIPFFKLFFIDFCMPIMDGPATCEKIREVISKAGLPMPMFCCCSAYEADDYADAADRAGMQLFITKPVTTKGISYVL